MLPEDCYFTSFKENLAKCKGVVGKAGTAKKPKQNSDMTGSWL